MAVQSDKLRLLRRIPQIRFEEELRGYSKSQVDRVLENLAPLADEIEVLQQHLATAEQRAASAEATAVQTGAAPASVSQPAAQPRPPEDFDEQLREVMLMAQRTAKERVETAEGDAEQIRAESKANADSLMASARTEAKELKGEAHAQREQMLSEAEEERAKMLELAKSDSEERRLAVEAQLVESEGSLREDLLSEIKELREKRTELAADLERFENHLGSRREAVKVALGEIDEAINHPEKLRENEILDIVYVSETDESSLTDIQVESSALEDLSGEAARARDALAAAAIPVEELQSPEPEIAVLERESAGEWTPPVVTDPMDMADAGLAPIDSMADLPDVPMTEAEAVDMSMPDLGIADSGLAPLPSAADLSVPDLAMSDSAMPDLAMPDLSVSDPSALAQDRGGFFDAAATASSEGSWDAPAAPSAPDGPLFEEPPVEEPPPSRGGLLSGFLGGRRSADQAPPPETAGYLPPPANETPGEPPAETSEGILGLRRRIAGAPHESFPEATPDLGADGAPSLAEAAMNAVTEEPPPPTSGTFSTNLDVPSSGSLNPFGEPAPAPESMEPIPFGAPSADAGRPPWADAIPEDVSSPLDADALAGGTSDQYLDELRRVTGDDAIPDENDEALDRFLSEDEDQGGGWFGRRK